MKKVDVTLYLVTDRGGMTVDVFLRKIEQACLGGVTLVQVREKECTTAEYINLALKVKEITDKYGVPMLIDDRADVAQAVGADGVHMGAEDMPVRLARQILGERKIIGATAKSVERARQAEKEGADYLGTGAIFEPTVKVKTHRTDIKTLDEICRSVTIPVAAISGINIGNVGKLAGVPIAGIAVIAAIMDPPTERVAEETRRLRERVEEVICVRC
ncbi:MAG: thiamine phosphate synthase [Clostridiales bacterium]|jgi:thiamine-phosphate pyrophosphorylase|nr:thiamine phosphate synthase [Clostridiales bacterium]